MGHANETITRNIYTHLFREDAAAFVSLLDEPLAAPGLRALMPLAPLR